MPDNDNNDATIYAAPRRTGKTAWLVTQAAAATASGGTVLVLTQPQFVARMEAELAAASPDAGSITVASSAGRHRLKPEDTPQLTDIFIDDAHAHKDSLIAKMQGLYPDAAVTATVEATSLPPRQQRRPHHIAGQLAPEQMPAAQRRRASMPQEQPVVKPKSPKKNSDNNIDNNKE